MDFKTETQLRQELADAWRLVDQYKQAGAPDGWTLVPNHLTDEMCRQIAVSAGLWPVYDTDGVPRAFFERIRKYHAGVIALTPNAEVTGAPRHEPNKE